MTPTTTTEAAGLRDTLQTTSVLTDLAAAVTSAQHIEGHHFLVLPAGYVHKDVTELVNKTMGMPDRKTGTTYVHDIDSLLQLCTDRAHEHADARGYLYADLDARTITAVWNDHRQANVPGWRDHRAVFKAEHTPEWGAWIGANRKDMQQETFAEFIEDNAADLPDAGVLLEVAGTLQAKTGIEFKSARRLHDGQVQLGYVETIDTKAGADGMLTVPKEFNIGVRIFKNGTGFLVRARLKYRLGGGSVKFRYELDRPERAVEVAFASYVTTLREKAPGFALLLGKAS